MQQALTVKLKPVSTLESKAGYAQLAVAPYAGGLNSTWWDRDLGIAGRVIVKESSGKIVTKLVNLNRPSPFNLETQAVPIIGLEDHNVTVKKNDGYDGPSVLGGEGTFAATQPPRLLKAVASELGIKECQSSSTIPITHDLTRPDGTILNWELELYDTQPAQIGGMDGEFIYAGRIDDKLCSWSAIQGLLASTKSGAKSSIIKLVNCSDNEEIGSLTRQGARSNILQTAIERTAASFGKSDPATMAQTYANSFLISADVSHAVNPNFLNVYLAEHAPRLNIGLAVGADPNGHMTTDAVSTALLQRVAEKTGSELQVFQIRNDSRSGGTIGPTLSSAMGCRSIDAGSPQLSMHSIRATTGSLDPGLGAILFGGFLDHYEEIDKEFATMT
ncbi:hypothetical protein MRB53_041821 [Persea americana]|nr:hypothetical protein MRB53_041821 [Persea americana]